MLGLPHQQAHLQLAEVDGGTIATSLYLGSGEQFIAQRIEAGHPLHHLHQPLCQLFPLDPVEVGRLCQLPEQVEEVIRAIQVLQRAP
ncbi:hypothetical protein D3C80_2099700 [compost metagenome]